MSNDLIEFLIIKNKFVSFLNDTNCLYKYRQYHINRINESIEKQIEEQLINYILFIKKEYTTFDSLKFQYKAVIEILNESQNLLKKFKSSIY
jgi:hypothetical protein